MIQSLVMKARMEIKRINNSELMKLQDIVENEVNRRETTKYNTEGESHERNLS